MTSKGRIWLSAAAALLLLLALALALPALRQEGAPQAGESSGVQRYLSETGTASSPAGGQQGAAAGLEQYLSGERGATAPADEGAAGTENQLAAGGPEPQAAPATGHGTARALLQCNFYDEANFLASVSQAQLYPVEGELTAGIVPHHLLAAPMIASFFKTAAASGPYDTVVFVATMHYPGEGEVITADQGFATPFGTAELDRELTGQLLADSTLAPLADNDLVEQDHAVSGLIPYVKYYLPEAKIALCQIANAADPRRQEALSSLLQQYTQTHRCLVVGSLDFSHHLTPREAAQRDRQTARALEAFDYGAIASMSDENLDSPYTARTILQLIEAQGAALRQLDHGSAEQFLQLPLSHQLYEDGATTYFIYAGSSPAAVAAPHQTGG